MLARWYLHERLLHAVQCHRRPRRQDLSCTWYSCFGLHLWIPLFSCTKANKRRFFVINTVIKTWLDLWNFILKIRFLTVITPLYSTWKNPHNKFLFCVITDCGNVAIMQDMLNVNGGRRVVWHHVFLYLDGTFFHNAEDIKAMTIILANLDSKPREIRSAIGSHVMWILRHV